MNIFSDHLKTERQARLVPWMFAPAPIPFVIRPATGVNWVRVKHIFLGARHRYVEDPSFKCRISSARPPRLRLNHAHMIELEPLGSMNCGYGDRRTYAVEQLIRRSA